MPEVFRIFKELQIQPEKLFERRPGWGAPSYRVEARIENENLQVTLDQIPWKSANFPAIIKRGGLRSHAAEADRLSRLAQVCDSYDIEILYTFGSRVRQALEWVERKRERLSSDPSDLDVGVKPYAGGAFPVFKKVELALALEDLFGVSRLDLVFFAGGGSVSRRQHHSG